LYIEQYGATAAVINLYPNPGNMKTFYNRIRAIRNVSSDEFPQSLSILLIIFFVLFGTASMFFLL
jgi:hypothetical protein